MFTNVFIQILNISFTASFVIFFVLIARMCLKKAPKMFSYMLWSVVLFRLVCPFSLESIWSFLPVTAASFSSELLYSQAPQVETGLSLLDTTINSVLPAPAPYASVNPLQVWSFIGSWIWLIGIGVLMIYSLVSFILLRKDLVGAVRLHDNVYLADHIKTAFVLGIWKPRIYLPSALSADEQSYILLHEQTHIRRWDHIAKLAAFVAVCIHWFNPLVWVAFSQCIKDMEMSCDESVMQCLDRDIRCQYCSSLLTLSCKRSTFSGQPLAFGEANTKSRIKNILHYKKASRWLILLGFAIVVIVCFGLIANPIQSQTRSITFPAYQDGKTPNNASIYATEPFTLSIQLPSGWRVVSPAVHKKPTICPWTPVDLYKGDTYMGYIGFSPFTLYEGVSKEDFYRSVYPELFIGSVISWDNDYAPVSQTDNFCAATCKVRERVASEDVSMAGGYDVLYPAILAYDKELLVYIAVQLEPNSVDDKELRSIAQSVVLSR